MHPIIFNDHTERAIKKRSEWKFSHQNEAKNAIESVFGLEFVYNYNLHLSKRWRSELFVSTVEKMQ
jgi:hypothetical protein